MSDLKEERMLVFGTPVAQYPEMKRKFRKEHPNAKILEEVKTLAVGQAEVPDPQLIGKTRMETMLMLYCMIIYEEKVTSPAVPIVN